MEIKLEGEQNNINEDAKFVEQLQGSGSRAYIAKIVGETTRSYKVGYTYKTAGTGSQTISGVGFRPRLVECFAWGSGNNKAISDGACDNAYNQETRYRYFDGAYWQNSRQPGAVIHILNAVGDTIGLGAITSLNADGFTLNWSDADETIYFTYRCHA